MDPVTIACIAGGAVVGSISALGWWVQSDWKLTRLLARTPRVRLDDLQEGTFGRVVGRAVQLDDVLVAPITGRRCVYWRVRVLDELKVNQEILGTVVRAPDSVAVPEGGYRGIPRHRLRMTSWRSRPMLISDRPDATR